TGLLLKVHSSNYRIVGFTASVSSADLVELGRAHGVPVMEDLGSGCLAGLTRYGFPHQPTLPEVGGGGDLVERLAKNPLNRALRIDKFTVAALEATLYAYEAGDALTTIPTLVMLTEPLVAIRGRPRRPVRPLPPGA